MLTRSLRTDFIIWQFVPFSETTDTKTSESQCIVPWFMHTQLCFKHPCDRCWDGRFTLGRNGLENSRRFWSNPHSIGPHAISSANSSWYDFSLHLPKDFCDIPLLCYSLPFRTQQTPKCSEASVAKERYYLWRHWHVISSDIMCCFLFPSIRDFIAVQCTAFSVTGSKCSACQSTAARFVNQHSLRIRKKNLTGSSCVYHSTSTQCDPFAE